MAHIDKFIQTLHKHSGDRLLVVPGEKVTLLVGEARHPVTNKPATEAQVDYLWTEIRPGEADLDDSGRSDFLYEAPSGPVRVEAVREGDVLRLEVIPAGTAVGNGNGASDPAVAQANGDGKAAAGGEPKTAGSSAGAGRDSDPAVLEKLLRRTVEEGCSDLHISADNPPAARKDGSMVVWEDFGVLSAERVGAMLLAIAPERNRQEFEERHDTDFAYEILDLARFRVNLFMDRKGPGGVFRVIPSEIMTVDDLGLTEHVLDLCRLTKGLVLVTGPTGSGKSTTLAAMVDYVNRTRADHVITIEDPIEFVHPNRKCLINQRQVGVHTQGFKVALRAALREDPDIVLVGELRDLETMEIALETAETGHLVFGTLHTTTAAATVDRIIDQFPSSQQNQIRMMLADTLRGVIAQTLCRKKGGGRVAAMEVLIVTPAVSNLIREGKTYQIPSAIQTGRGSGMQSLTHALVELVQSGQVEPQEAYLRAVDKSELQGAFNRAGINFDPTSGKSG